MGGSAGSGRLPAGRYCTAYRPSGPRSARDVVGLSRCDATAHRACTFLKSVRGPQANPQNWPPGAPHAQQSPYCAGVRQVCDDVQPRCCTSRDTHTPWGYPREGMTKRPDSVSPGRFVGVELEREADECVAREVEHVMPDAVASVGCYPHTLRGILSRAHGHSQQQQHEGDHATRPTA